MESVCTKATGQAQVWLCSLTYLAPRSGADRESKYRLGHPNYHRLSPLEHSASRYEQSTNQAGRTQEGNTKQRKRNQDENKAKLMR